MGSVVLICVIYVVFQTIRLMIPAVKVEMLKDRLKKGEITQEEFDKLTKKYESEIKSIESEGLL